MAYLIYPVCLRLFDGDGGELGGDTQTGGQSAAGDLSEMPLGKTEGSDAGSDTSSTEKPEDKAAKFRELIKGEYKDVYTKEFEKIFDRRFKAAKENEERLNSYTPIFDKLMARYGVEDVSALDAAIDSDTNFWEEAAEKAGMDVNSFRQFTKLQRENARFAQAQQQQEAQKRMAAQVQQWAADAEALKASGDYDFDIRSELQNPEVRRLLMAGAGFRAAYEATHMEDIKRSVAAKAEKKTVDNVRAKGMRPAENGSATSTGISFNPGDPATWTDAQIDEAIRRAKRGETIKL